MMSRSVVQLRNNALISCLSACVSICMSIARQCYRNALEVSNLRKQGRDDGLEYYLYYGLEITPNYLIRIISKTEIALIF